MIIVYIVLFGLFFRPSIVGNALLLSTPRWFPIRPWAKSQGRLPDNLALFASNQIEDSRSESIEEQYVSLLLRVSYDGARFSGWSAGNDARSTSSKQIITHPPRSSRRCRNRHIYSADSQGIRSVQGVLQLALSKLYGNIDPSLLVVEGVSRTDACVHAIGMVAQIYALSKDYNSTDNLLQDEIYIEGKRLPHPRNGTDPSSAFLPLRMSPSKLTFSLNRMLPPDVRVISYAHIPQTTNVFHASQSAVAKTYSYRLAVGKRCDPTQAHCTWYVIGDLAWRQEAVTPVIQMLTAQDHDFAAFCGAPRGKDDKQKRLTQSTKCRLHQISVQFEKSMNDWSPDIVIISITGDRFLYKMVRFLVGTLLGVATGSLSISQVQRMLDEGIRPTLVQCAPARGLVLEEVHYEGIDWILANS